MHEEIKSYDGFGVYEAEKWTDLSNTDRAKISKLRLECKYTSRFVTEGLMLLEKEVRSVIVQDVQADDEIFKMIVRERHPDNVLQWTD